MKLTKVTNTDKTYRIYIDEFPAGGGFQFNNVYVDFDAQGNSTGGTFKKGSPAENAILWNIEKHGDQLTW